MRSVRSDSFPLNDLASVILCSAASRLATNPQNERQRRHGIRRSVSPLPKPPRMNVWTTNVTHQPHSSSATEAENRRNLRVENKKKVDKNEGRRRRSEEQQERFTNEWTNHQKLLLSENSDVHLLLEPMNPLRSFLARLLFLLHALICVWRAWMEWDRWEIWLLILPCVLGIFEGLLRNRYYNGHEHRWFSFSVFFYLCSIVPCIWFIQWKLTQLYKTGWEGWLHFPLLLWHSKDDNRTRQIIRPNYLNADGVFSDEIKCGENSAIENVNEIGRVAQHKLDLDQITTEFLNTENVTIWIPFLEMESSTWLTLIEQSLLVVLIIGRWMMPSGKITPDILSQLLLVWLAIGADIVDLFDTVIKECKIFKNENNVILVLIIWTVSLIQFPVQITGRSRKARAVAVRKLILENSRRIKLDPALDNLGHISFCAALLSHLEFWSIVFTTLLQDGPFLALRLYLLTRSELSSYNMVFFTSKNFLVVMLQLFRLYGIFTRIRDDVKGRNLLKEARNKGGTVKISDEGYIGARRRRRKTDRRNIVDDGGTNNENDDQNGNDSDEEDDENGDVNYENESDIPITAASVVSSTSPITENERNLKTDANNKDNHPRRSQQSPMLRKNCLSQAEKSASRNPKITKITTTNEEKVGKRERKDTHTKPNSNHKGNHYEKPKYSKNRTATSITTGATTSASAPPAGTLNLPGINNNDRTNLVMESLEDHGKLSSNQIINLSNNNSPSSAVMRLMNFDDKRHSLDRVLTGPPASSSSSSAYMNNINKCNKNGPFVRKTSPLLSSSFTVHQPVRLLELDQRHQVDRHVSPASPPISNDRHFVNRRGRPPITNRRWDDGSSLTISIDDSKQPPPSSSSHNHNYRHNFPHHPSSSPSPTHNFRFPQQQAASGTGTLRTGAECHSSIKQQQRWYPHSGGTLVDEPSGLPHRHIINNPYETPSLLDFDHPHNKLAARSPPSRRTSGDQQQRKLIFPADVFHHRQEFDTVSSPYSMPDRPGFRSGSELYGSGRRRGQPLSGIGNDNYRRGVECDGVGSDTSQNALQHWHHQNAFQTGSSPFSSLTAKHYEDWNYDNHGSGLGGPRHQQREQRSSSRNRRFNLADDMDRISIASHGFRNIHTADL